jgi:hypothetical protein
VCGLRHAAYLLIYFVRATRGREGGGGREGGKGPGEAVIAQIKWSSAVRGRIHLRTRRLRPCTRAVRHGGVCIYVYTCDVYICIHIRIKYVYISMYTYIPDMRIFLQRDRGHVIAVAGAGATTRPHSPAGSKTSFTLYPVRAERGGGKGRRLDRPWMRETERARASEREANTLANIG